jgi:prevent-host-death family protein
MKTITIRELHAKTGEWVREAARYGQIRVTDNGRPVARILPETEPGGAPYFANRKPSAAFARLDSSGRTARGTDVTQLISDNREDRI